MKKRIILTTIACLMVTSTTSLAMWDGEKKEAKNSDEVSIMFFSPETKVNKKMTKAVTSTSTVKPELTSTVEPELISTVEPVKITIANQQDLTYNGEKISWDVTPQIINGKFMVPARFTLEKMGFEISWNPKTKSVSIMKGARYTSISVGKNSYFKNRMAPIKLSSEPVIVEGRTMIPVEFFPAMLDVYVTNKDNVINLTDENMTIDTGYVQSYEKNGKKSKLVISSKQVSEDISDQIIFNLNEDTIIQVSDIKNGNIVNVVTPPFSTMSIPAQKHGVVIY